MRRFPSWVLIVWLLVGLASADETITTQVIEKYEDAFNRQDVSAMGAIWSESAVLEDESAQTKLVGREAITRQLKSVFSDDNPPKLSIVTDSVTVQDDGSILVSGTNTLTISGAPKSRSESFAFSALIKSIDGKLQIAHVSETIGSDDDEPRASPVHALAWLVGSWTSDNGDEESGISNEFRFMPGEQFIVRTFSARNQPAGSSLGYQIIGALPGDQQLRSWTFLADGSVSSGDWIVDDERISIKSKGRLADGSQVSGTYVLKRDGEDSMTMKIVGHTIDGEPVPSVGAVALTRQLQNATSSSKTRESTDTKNQSQGAQQ